MRGHADGSTGGGGGGGGGGSAARRGRKLRSCMDTIQRVVHDGALPTACFSFGYLDRFVGIIERDIASANWGDIALLDLANAKEMAVPKHRIQYIKCNGEIVWDKRDRTDLFWASGRDGESGGIMKVLARQLDAGLWSRETMLPVDPEVAAGAEAKAREAAAAAAATGSNNRSRRSLDKQRTAKSSGHHQKRAINKTTNSSGRHKRDSGDITTSDRPNYFISLRVTSAHARRLANTVHRAIVSAHPVLAEACLPLRALHITLLTLRLDHPAQIKKAQRALSRDAPETLALRRALAAVCPAATQAIGLDGVESFREGRVIYGRLAPQTEVAIASLREIVLQRMTEAELTVCELDREFHPHMTIAKLSRGLCRKGVEHIDARFYANAVEKFFKTRQPPHIVPVEVRGMFLCEMKPIATNAAPNGFYVPVARIDAPPSSSTQSSSSADSASCLTPVTADTRAGISSPRPLVVIVRGTPGSGKSTLIRKICEEFLHSTSHHERRRAVLPICSNDDYFVDAQTGTYAWKKDQQGSAQAQCWGTFKGLLLAGGNDAGEPRSSQPTPNIVFVDNVHVRTSSYARYKILAERCGCRTLVLDLRCPSAEACLVAARRNVHRVPAEHCRAMYHDWEEDSTAVRLVAPADSTTLREASTAVASALDEEIGAPASVDESPRRPNLRQHSSGKSLRQLSNEGKALARMAMGEKQASEKREARVVYVGAFLSKATQSAIFSQLPAIHEHLVCDHVTLFYAPTREEYYDQVSSNVGALAVYDGTRVVGDAGCQALLVRPRAEIGHSNTVKSRKGQRLHVTMSLSEGTTAVTAHALSRNFPANSSSPSICQVEGIVGVVISYKSSFGRKGKKPRRRTRIVFDPNELRAYDLVFAETAKQRPKEGETQSMNSLVEYKTQQTARRRPKELHLLAFDFDQTLFFTPDTTDYERILNVRWDQAVHWPRDKRSLSGLMVDAVRAGPALSFLYDRVAALKAQKESSDSIVCVVTGRPKCMEPQVVAMLKRWGIDHLFDRLLFAPRTSQHRAVYRLMDDPFGPYVTVGLIPFPLLHMLVARQFELHRTPGPNP